MTILLLSGSPSTPSRSSRLLHHVGDKLKELGYHTQSLNVKDLPAQALLHADFAHPELIAAKQKLAQAKAIVIATPIYKAAYSGLLKTFLDILPQDGLSGKLVLPLATGGSQSHLLALDYALRPVLAALAADHVLTSVYATDAQVNWSEQDGLKIDPSIIRRLQYGINHLAARLISLREPEVSSMPDRCSA